MVTKYITKRTGELRIYKPRNSRVVRIDDQCHKMLGKIDRSRGENDGDVVKRILKDYCMRNAIPI